MVTVRSRWLVPVSKATGWSDPSPTSIASPSTPAAKAPQRLEALRRLLVDEHHVAQRRSIQPVPRAREIADGRERIGRVRQGLAEFLARAREQLEERRVAGQLRAQRDGIHEVADHVARGRALASGCRCADKECRLCGVAREQRLEGGEQRHE